MLFRPYRVGDFVEAAGVSGSVEQVQILTTILKTPDNKQIIVPNSQIMDSIITNYWVKTADYWSVYFGLTEAIKKRFDEDGISFPFPQQDVHLYKAD
ncbi:MAG: mechanosensitive ion channel [Proteobacteria bacterium]|nr:mechanosensitive ion channel [Pseudomonadota bacterium]